MLHDAIDDERAWKRETVSPADWIVPLPQACLTELDEIVRFLRTYPQPVQHLTPEAFVPTCASMMAQVREKIQQVGLAVVDRVPVERYSVTENRAIGWLLAALMGQVVAQKWDSTLQYNVKEPGKSSGYGVRPAVTKLEQHFHTDGVWLGLPPTSVGLFCLHPAQHGGMGRLVNLLTVHNELLRRHSALLARLYGPFWWNRQTAHALDNACASRHPVYQYDGHALIARYDVDRVYKGYGLAGEALDDTGAAALAAMRTIINAPENWTEWRLEQGQLQYINNCQFAHAHPASVDVPGVSTPHHILRLWNRYGAVSAHMVL